MYKLCRTERSAARQRELELGLLELMQSRRYDQITVSDLCQRMQISRKAFYRYFSGKDGALCALLDHTLLEYVSFPGGYRPGEPRTIEKDLERFFLFWKEQSVLLDVLERNGCTAMLTQRCMDTSMAGTPIPMHFAKAETEEGRRALLIFTLCGLMSMVSDWHRRGFPQSAAHMGTLAARMLDSPLFSAVSAK